MEDEVEKIEKMTLEEFKKYCNKEDYNIIDEYDFKRFPISCGKCKSKNIDLVFRGEEGAMGSAWTGYMKGFIHDAGLLIKCKKCGSAVIIRVPDC